MPRLAPPQAEASNGMTYALTDRALLISLLPPRLAAVPDA